MAVWYFFGAKYNENYTAEADAFAHRLDELPLLGMDVGANLNEARAHGNPFLDTSSMIRQESTAVMGGQMQTYDTEDQARAAGGEAAPSVYQKLFEAMPGMWQQNHGFHIIDADHPELLEHGEAYIHERLTSYVAEPFREGSEVAVPPYVRSYVERSTV
ncbi:MAG: hypothetical protein ACRDTV_03050, partial [Mycobacterium sp.]